MNPHRFVYILDGIFEDTYDPITLSARNLPDSIKEGYDMMSRVVDVEENQKHFKIYKLDTSAEGVRVVGGHAIGVDVAALESLYDSTKSNILPPIGPGPHFYLK